jgi:Asp-tRNA(Asn)/Glu-tRNA(Gln) amidotransferase A subunit family amidase
MHVGVIQQTMGEGVAAGVTAAVQGALQHMQQLGAAVEEVSLLTWPVIIFFGEYLLHVST